MPPVSAQRQVVLLKVRIPHSSRQEIHFTVRRPLCALGRPCMSSTSPDKTEGALVVLTVAGFVTTARTHNNGDRLVALLPVGVVRP